MNAVRWPLTPGLTALWQFCGVMYNRYNIKIGCHYFGGNAKLKCQTPDVIDIISKHDIFAVMESWLDKGDSCPVMNGFANFRSDRKKKRKSKRGSGGILIYCRSKLVNGVSKISSFSDDLLWLKLDRYFFGLPNDVYMCVAYLCPWVITLCTGCRPIAGTDKRDRLLFNVGQYSNHRGSEQSDR